MPIKSLFILSLLFILTGCGDSEVKAQEADSNHPGEIASQRMNAMPYYCHQTNLDMKKCSYELSNQIDKEIIELTKDSEVFSLEHFRQFAFAAIDQEYPCHDFVPEQRIWLSIRPSGCGYHPLNNACDEADDIEPPDDRVFDDEGKCLRQINYGSSETYFKNMTYIRAGEEYKRMLIYSSLQDTKPLISPYLMSQCIREISLHVPTKDCIAQMENAGGTWLNDSIMIFNNQAIDITKAYSDEVFYTGELTFKDDKNRRDVLYLIYGHDFSHRVMNYESGVLNGMSSYVDQGGNPVLLEWYEDGVLISQSSAAHEAKDRGRNYSDFCGPSRDPGGWRSCPNIKGAEYKDIDFDGDDELIVLFRKRGNRHYKEYKAYNIDGGELVLHYREDAVFDSETKTVINHWSSNFCTHETETYQAMNNTLEMVRLEFSDYEPDGYGCILRIFESSSDSGNKSLQDFDDEMLRIIGEKRYGMSGANLELIDTKCWNLDRNFSEC